MENVRTMSCGNESPVVMAIRAVCHIVPLLDQYCHLVEYMVTEMVATHRTSAKLLSVLLGIFSELVQKVTDANLNRSSNVLSSLVSCMCP